jgi:hypothetical protein
MDTAYNTDDDRSVLCKCWMRRDRQVVYKVFTVTTIRRCESGSSCILYRDESMNSEVDALWLCDIGEVGVVQVRVIWTS